MTQEIFINLIILGISILFAGIAWWILRKIRIQRNSIKKQVPFIIEERKIQRVVSVYILSKSEKELFPKYPDIKKNRESLVAHNLLMEMIHIGAIKFVWSKTEDGSDCITATTYVPEKL